MRAILTVDLDQTAFADGAPGAELARILRNVAEYADGEGPRGLMALNGRTFRDINGNKVGELRIEDDATPDPGEHCYRCGKPATAYVTDGPVCAGHKARLRS